MITRPNKATRQLNFDEANSNDPKPKTVRRSCHRNAKGTNKSKKYDLNRMNTAEFDALLSGVDPALEAFNGNVQEQKKKDEGLKKKSELIIHNQVKVTKNIYSDASSEENDEGPASKPSDPEEVDSPALSSYSEKTPTTNNGNSSLPNDKEATASSLGNQLVPSLNASASGLTSSSDGAPSKSTAKENAAPIVSDQQNTLSRPRNVFLANLQNTLTKSSLLGSRVSAKSVGSQPLVLSPSRCATSDTMMHIHQEVGRNDLSVNPISAGFQNENKAETSTHELGKVDKSVQTNRVFIGCECVTCDEILNTFCAHNNGCITKKCGDVPVKETSMASTVMLSPHTPKSSGDCPDVNSDGEVMVYLIKGCPQVKISLSRKGALPSEVPDRDPQKIVEYLLDSLYTTLEFARMTHDGKTQDSNRLPGKVAKVIQVYTAAKYDSKQFNFDISLFKKFVNTKCYAARRFIWKNHPELVGVEHGIRPPMKKNTRKNTEGGENTEKTPKLKKGSRSKSSKKSSQKDGKRKRQENQSGSSKKKSKGHENLLVKTKDKVKGDQVVKRRDRGNKDEVVKRRDKGNEDEVVKRRDKGDEDREVRRRDGGEDQETKKKDNRNRDQVVKRKERGNEDEVKKKPEKEVDVMKKAVIHSTPIRVTTGGKRPRFTLEQVKASSISKPKESHFNGKKRKKTDSESEEEESSSDDASVLEMHSDGISSISDTICEVTTDESDTD